MHRELLGNSRCIFYRMTDKQLLRTELRSKCGYFYPHYHNLISDTRTPAVHPHQPDIYSSLDQRAGIADKVFGDIGAVFCDPFHRDRLFFVADNVDILQCTFHGVRRITLTFKCDHLSGFAVQGSLYTKFTGEDAFFAGLFRRA